MSIKVYDVLGREVTTLVNERKEAGSYAVRWAASNQASGIYFYRIHAVGLKAPGTSFTDVKKMILIR